jgi:glyoxylase I family protein
MHLKGIHHVAIICSNYEQSKCFYTEVLPFKVIAEHYREDRQSYKLDLELNGQYSIELFSFNHAPQRLSRPEATGLRHLAFSVEDLNGWMNYLNAKGVICEPVRTDEFTGKRFTFFSDPDHLPLELYEQ